MGFFGASRKLESCYEGLGVRVKGSLGFRV